MSEMPLEPQLAKMLLISPEYHCSNEVERESVRACVRESERECVSVPVCVCVPMCA